MRGFSAPLVDILEGFVAALGKVGVAGYPTNTILTSWDGSFDLFYIEADE
jgi:hypothetical protein